MITFLKAVEEKKLGINNIVNSYL